MTRLARLFAKLRAPAMVAMCALGIVAIVVALDACHQIGVAHADTGQVVAAAPVAPVPVPLASAPFGDSLIAIVALVAAVLGGIGAMLGGLSVVLHAIARRTKTTVDDTLAADVDAGRAKLDELLSLLRLIPVPPANVTSAPAVSFDSKTAITAKLPQSGRVHIGAALVLAFAAILALPLLGCASSQRADTIKAALITVDAARDGFLAYDASHQAAIVAAATSKEDGQAKLAAYRATRDRVEVAFPTAYHAIAAAAIANDDPSIASMQAIIAQLIAAAQPFIGGK